MFINRGKRASPASANAAGGESERASDRRERLRAAQRRAVWSESARCAALLRARRQFVQSSTWVWQMIMAAIGGSAATAALLLLRDSRVRVRARDQFCAAIK